MPKCRNPVPAQPHIPSTVKLDRYDLLILQTLARDGRITKSNLAATINLSITPTWERVRKLERTGLIKGYRAVVDWEKLFKRDQVLMVVTLAIHTGAAMRRFEQRLAAAPEIAFCYATGGGVDYVAMVRCQGRPVRLLSSKI